MRPNCCLGHHFLCDTFKRLRVEFGECRKDLAVDKYLLLGRNTYELGISEAERAECGIHLYLPHAAKVSFLVLAVLELIGSCLSECDLCLDLFGRSSVAITLSGLEYLLAVFV